MNVRKKLARKLVLTLLIAFVFIVAISPLVVPNGTWLGRIIMAVISTLMLSALSILTYRDFCKMCDMSEKSQRRFEEYEKASQRDTANE